MSNDALLSNIKVIDREAKKEYGWPRMQKELILRGIRAGKERVRKLMQQHGIRARHKRKWVATTASKHALLIAPNLLQLDFSPSKPNQVWTTDITYIHTKGGWPNNAHLQFLPLEIPWVDKPMP